MALRIAVDHAKVSAALARFPAELAREAEVSLRQSGEVFVNKMIGRFRGYTGTKGDLLQNRTGALRRSFSYEVGGRLGPGQTLSLIGISSGTRYARLQEFGGTVVPLPPRKFLTIPIADNLTPAGDVRFKSAADLRDRYPGQTFINRTADGLFIFSRGQPGAAPKLGRKRKDGTRAKAPEPELLLLFKLVRKVTIQPRLGMRKVWLDLGPDRNARLTQAFGRAALRSFQ